MPENEKKNETKTYKSGLEARCAAAAGGGALYESLSIPYIRPAKICRYTPDFVLPNGIVVETKGRFEAADRKKHLLVREAFPDIDIRFVFSNSRNRLNKRSTTTYADFCEKNGFLYADKEIPESWLKEEKNEKSAAVLERLAAENLSKKIPPKRRTLDTRKEKRGAIKRLEKKTKQEAGS